MREMASLPTRIYMALEQHAYDLLSLSSPRPKSMLPPSYMGKCWCPCTHRNPEQYIPFSTVTQRALKHTLAEAGESLPQSEIDSLMKAYDSLSTFPDVAGCLKAVSQDSGIAAVVFSNGTHVMVSSSLKNSPDLAPQAAVFKDIVVVDDVQKFKPDKQVYQHLCKKVGKQGKENEVWLVSGNPFDVVGARSVGLNVAWVDRAGNGWVDSCVEGEKGRPTVIVKSLEEVVKSVRSYG